MSGSQVALPSYVTQGKLFNLSEKLSASVNQGKQSLTSSAVRSRDSIYNAPIMLHLVATKCKII